VDFDEFAGDYSRHVDQAVAFSGQSQGFFLEAKARHLIAILRERFGAAATPRVLEIGCGPGLMQRRVHGDGRRVWGIDTSLALLAKAGRSGSDAPLIAADGGCAPFPDGCFDLAFAVCVLHHVAPERRPQVLAEMARVVRPGGLVAIWEHNAWNPLTRRVVAHCPFDRDAVLLSLPETNRLLRQAGLVRTFSRYALFFPWSGRGWQRADRLLSWLPLGAQFAAFGERP
jgi:SAM-dependent methyltransferase